MPRVVAETAGMSREEWLQYRLQGIGGSDAAALIRLPDGGYANPYKSPIIVYMEKTGQYEQEVGEPAYWGNRLESIVADEFKIRYEAELSENHPEFNEQPQGVRVQRRNAIFAHDEHDFMRANVDRLIFCPVRGRGLLECKTANQYLADEWKGDDVPDQYYVQAQHYLEVMDLEYAYIAVLIGGQKYKHYHIERNRDFGQSLIEIQRRFWHDHVLAGVQPPIDGFKHTSEMYKTMYPDSEEGTTLELPSTFVQLVEERESFKLLKEQHEERQKACENQIKDAMKETEIAFAGPHKITWKTAKNGVRALKIKMGAK